MNTGNNHLTTHDPSVRVQKLSAPQAKDQVRTGSAMDSKGPAHGQMMIAGKIWPSL